MKEEKGFTLFELMVVIAIIGVFTAMSTPSFLGWLTARRIDTAASDINAAIRVARLNAVKRNTSAFLQFDVDAESYDITVAGDTVKRGKMPADVDLETTAPGGLITFDSRGFPTPPVNIVLQNTAGTTRTIQVSLTGGSRIF